MAKLRGKETCNLGFLLAFLQAREKANKEGRTVPIEGYGGWSVSSQKGLKDE